MEGINKRRRRNNRPTRRNPTSFTRMLPALKAASVSAPRCGLSTDTSCLSGRSRKECADSNFTVVKPGTCDLSQATKVNIDRRKLC